MQACIEHRHQKHGRAEPRAQCISSSRTNEEGKGSFSLLADAPRMQVVQWMARVAGPSFNTGGMNSATSRWCGCDARGHVTVVPSDFALARAFALARIVVLSSGRPPGSEVASCCSGLLTARFFAAYGQCRACNSGAGFRGVPAGDSGPERDGTRAARSCSRCAASTSRTELGTGGHPCGTSTTMPPSASALSWQPL